LAKLAIHATANSSKVHKSTNTNSEGYVDLAHDSDAVVKVTTKLSKFMRSQFKGNRTPKSTQQTNTSGIGSRLKSRINKPYSKASGINSNSNSPGKRGNKKMKSSRFDKASTRSRKPIKSRKYSDAVKTKFKTQKSQFDYETDPVQESLLESNIQAGIIPQNSSPVTVDAKQLKKQRSELNNLEFENLK
jgi:hypothetical protein